MKRVISSKKTVSMALAVTMCFGIACSAGFLTKAAELEEIDDNVVAAQSTEVQGGLTSRANRFAVKGLNYRVINDTSVAVVGYNFPDHGIKINLKIPATVSHNKTTYIVTSIDDSAFEECQRLESVTLSNMLTSIGEYAFFNCSQLKRINLSESLTFIGEAAFGQCYSLEKVNLPNSLTSIGDGIFYECSQLKQINLPESLTSIGDDAFSGCYSLEKIDLPNTLTSIGKYAFSDCALSNCVYIPKSVTSIGSYAFDFENDLTDDNLVNFVLPERFKGDIENPDLGILSGRKNVQVSYYN